MRHLDSGYCMDALAYTSMKPAQKVWQLRAEASRKLSSNQRDVIITLRMDPRQTPSLFASSSLGAFVYNTTPFTANLSTTACPPSSRIIQSANAFAISLNLPRVPTSARAGFSISASSSLARYCNTLCQQPSWNIELNSNNDFDQQRSCGSTFEV